MNIVRIVALGAAAVGVAIAVAGQFQGSQDAETAVAQLPAPMPAAPALESRPSLVTASAAPTPSLTQPAPSPEPAPAGTAIVAAEPPTIPAMPAPEAEPVSLASNDTASIIADLPEGRLGRAAVLLPPEATAPIAGMQEPLRSPEVLEGLARSAERNLTPSSGPLIAATADTEPLDPSLEAELNACAIWLVVTPSTSAMLDASVYAPCDQGAVIEMSHAGLSFDARIGDDGQLLMMIPALSEDGEVTIRFADGREQSDASMVPDLAGIDRVALQWTAPAALSLQAYEFGAQFGDAGHIHAGNPSAPGNPSRGFMTLLGDPGLPQARLAQVYSYPTGESPVTGRVALEVEVPVTDATCGNPVTAHALQLNGVTGTGQVRAINVAMPACDGAGGYVVLPGVLADLQIALN